MTALVAYITRQPRHGNFFEGFCLVHPIEARYNIREREMETIKTASFEYLIGLAKEKDEGGFEFNLDGTVYHIDDVLEISKIATSHGYIVIY